MHPSTLHLPDLKLLNLFLTIVIVLFVTLAYCAKRGIAQTRDVLGGGVALILGGDYFMFPICERMMVAEFGHTTKASMLAALPVLFITVVFVFLLRVIIQVNERGAATMAPPPSRLSKTARVKAAGKAGSGPAPKPQRSRGGKRRF